MQRDFNFATSPAYKNIAPDFIEKYPLIKRALDLQYKALRVLDGDIYKTGQNQILNIIETTMPDLSAREKEKVMAAAIIMTCVNNDENSDDTQFKMSDVRRKLGSDVVDIMMGGENDDRTYEHYLRICMAIKIQEAEQIVEDILSGREEARDYYCGTLELGGTAEKMAHMLYTDHFGGTPLLERFNATEKSLQSVALFPQEKTKRQMALVN